MDWTGEFIKQRAEAFDAFGVNESSADYSRSGTAYPSVRLDVAVKIARYWLGAIRPTIESRARVDKVVWLAYDESRLKTLLEPSRDLLVLYPVIAVARFSGMAEERAAFIDGMNKAALGLIRAVGQPIVAKFLTPESVALLWDSAAQMAFSANSVSAGNIDYPSLSREMKESLEQLPERVGEAVNEAARAAGKAAKNLAEGIGSVGKGFLDGLFGGFAVPVIVAGSVIAWKVL